jgi:hypothetical protein
MLTAVALAALAGAGCGQRDAVAPPTAGSLRLVPDAQAPRDERFLAWGGTVDIDGVSRRVLSAAKPVLPPTEILPAEPGGQRRVNVRIPDDFKPLPWAVYELVTLVGDQVKPVRVWPITGRQAGSTYAAAVTEARVDPNGKPAVRLWPVPDLASRDVDTAEVRVPDQGLLRVGIGLEPASWDTTIVPVDMTVSSVEGQTVTALSTTRLEVRRPDHRRWVDVAVPLDALAGRTVRFRFSSRPLAGGTAAPSLPVWAEPTIVKATRRHG